MVRVVVPGSRTKSPIEKNLPLIGFSVAGDRKFEKWIHAYGCWGLGLLLSKAFFSAGW